MVGKNVNSSQNELDGVEKMKDNWEKNNKTQFLNDFLKNKSENSNPWELLNELFEADTITSNISSQLEGFLNDSKSDIVDSSWNKLDRYYWFKLDEISLNELKKLFLPQYTKIQHKRQLFNDVLLWEFNFGEIPAKLNKEITWLDNKKLTKLLQWDFSKRKKYLVKVLWKKQVPASRNLCKLLEKINYQQRAKKIKDELNFEQLEKVESTFEGVVEVLDRLNNGVVDSVDIQVLSQLDFFNKDELFEIITWFLPVLDLETVLKLNLLKPEESNGYKKSMIEEYILSNGIESISQDDLSKMVDNIRNKDVLISTKKHLGWEYQIDTIAKDLYIAHLNIDLEKEVKKHLEEENTESTNEGTESNNLNQELVGKFLNSLEKKWVDLDKLESWNILVLRRRSKIGSDEAVEENLYFELLDPIFDGTNFNFIQRWIDLYDNVNPQKAKQNLNVMISLIEHEAQSDDERSSIVSADILTKNEIKEKINKGQIKQDTDKIDYDSQEEIEKRIEDIKAEMEEFKETQFENGLWEEEVYQSPKYLELNKELDDLNNSHINKLLFLINELDKDWEKYGLVEWTVIHVEKNFKTKQEWLYSIEKIDNDSKMVILVWLSGKTEEITFDEFYSTFKQKEAKRTSNTNNFSTLFEYHQTSNSQWWKFEFINGEIHNKETKSDINYNYLISADGEETFKIEAIYGDSVKITFWKAKQDKDKDKNDVTKLSMEDSSHTIKVWMLDHYIKKHNLIPRSINEDKEIDTNLPEWNKIRGSFVARFFSRLSIADLVAWWKVWLESIENYLNEWNSEQAARFASSVLGKVLPAELQRDLQTRAESEKRKRMDEHKDKLKAVDSYVAVWMIEEWLLNRDTPQYKKEAWMIFMLENYGTLYAKGGLFKHKWTYLWYEAMWGKIGDKLYREEEEKASKSNLPFDEDELVFVLMKKQCWTHWYNWIKRRTRLHKEFKWLRWKWQDDEWKKGEDDGGLSRNVDDRVRYWLWELDGGTYINAMGAMAPIIWKGAWDEFHKLNKLPFVMLFSWEALTFNESMIDKFKNHLNKWEVIPSIWLMSNKYHMELQNKVVLELAKDFGEIYGWKYSNMYKDALEIFNNQKSTSIKPKDKVINASKFFDKYGEAITRSMAMLNTWKTDELSKTEKLIYLKKDVNPIYNTYFKQFNDWMEGNAEFTNDDFLTDGALWAGVSWVNIYKATMQNIEFTQWGSFRHGIRWQHVWKEIYSEIEALANKERKYDISWVGEDLEIRSKILKMNLRWFLAGIFNTHWWNTTALFALNKASSPLASRLNKWWISMKEIYRNKLSFNEILDESNAQANQLLDRYVDNILNDRWAIEPSFDDIFSAIDVNKKAVNSAIDYDQEAA